MTTKPTEEETLLVVLAVLRAYGDGPVLSAIVSAIDALAAEASDHPDESRCIRAGQSVREAAALLRERIDGGTLADGLTVALDVRG